jgi:DNA-binding response OmpR family regulator/Tfp pilus assembly protein PilF
MKNEVRKPHREKQREEAATQKVKAELKAALSGKNDSVFREKIPERSKFPILIVEDQPLMRKAFKRVLDSAGIFVIQEAQSPKDAIQHLRNHAVDLVILDLYLNKGSGLEVLNYLRSRPIANDIPIIFVTGEASRDDIVHAVELGVSDYLIKPFDPQDLLHKVRSVLAQFVDPPKHLKMLRHAESLLLRGDYLRAHADFLKLREDEPHSPRVIVGLSQAEWKLGNTKVAKELIEEAIELADLCFPAYALMADILIEEGRKQDAVEFLLRELSLNGKRSGRRVQLAELYFELHDVKASFEQLRLALIDYPNDEGLLIRTAKMHLDSGDNEKALHYFLKTRRNVPRSALALKGISEVCCKSNQPQKALQIFSDFLRQKPQQADVLFARAQTYEHMNMLDESMADIESSLLLEPDNMEVLCSKGRLLKRSGQEMPARMVWASLSRMDPSADNLTQIGLVNFRAGDFAQAALYFERAVFSEAHHGNALYHLALSYKKLGQNGKAKSICQQAIALLPENENFKKLLSALSGTKLENTVNKEHTVPKAG